VLDGSAAKHLEELWYRQLLEKLLMSPLMLPVVRSFAEVAFVSRLKKKKEHKFVMYCL